MILKYILVPNSPVYHIKKHGDSYGVAICGLWFCPVDEKTDTPPPDHRICKYCDRGTLTDFSAGPLPWPTEKGEER